MLARGVAHRAVADPFQPSAPPLRHTSLQRKVAFKGNGEEAVDAKFVLRRLLESRHALPGDEDVRFVAQLQPSVAERALRRLRESATPYGTFDLSNDVDLQFLYYELRKEIHKPEEAADDPATEIEASQHRAAEERTARRRYRANAPDIGRTYDLALLGTGASIAYYITSHRHEIDKPQTIAMGRLQPWAKIRGPGVVNHPMHMITPKRDEVGLDDEALAPRDAFSEKIAEVLDENVRITLDCDIKKITHVKQGGAWFYKIDVELFEGEPRVYYARDVVFGLGIGEHKLPPVRKGVQDATLDTLGGRAMNMDEFQRRAEEIRAKEKDPVTVVISGPNAGIDAVKTAIEHKFEIYWVTGSGRPGFLKGTDNEGVEEQYDACDKGKTSKIHAIVKEYAYRASANPDTSQGAKPIVVDTGKDEDKSRGAAYSQKLIAADYYVWAPGPNTALVKGILGDEFKNLVETYDRNRQFAADGSPAVVGLEAGPREDETDKTSLKIVGGAAYRLAEGRDYAYPAAQLGEARALLRAAEKLKLPLTQRDADDHGLLELVTSLGQAAGASLDTLPDTVEKIQRAKAKNELPPVSAPSFARLPEIDAHVAQKVDRPRKELARAYRIALQQVLVCSKALRTFTQEVGAYFEAIDRKDKPVPKDPRKTWTQMDKVISTLPINVLMNDQLTSTRSQIEADAAFVPDYVRDDANFATDSATVLRIYISVHYPFLKNAQIDEWVDRIVRWRRPSDADRGKYTRLWGPIPNPSTPKKERESAQSFTAWFKRRLAEEQEKLKVTV